MGKTAIDAKRGQTTFRVSPSDSRLRVIGRDTNHREGDHVLYQDRALEAPNQGLVNSMVANGFQGSIDVRVDGSFWDIVVGRRRVIAAREAEKILAAQGIEFMIEIRPIKGTDLEMVEHMISENALREDPNPIQMAVDLNRFIKMGASDSQAARALGKGVQSLKLYLKLLDLAPEVQEAVRRGDLAMSAALELVKLERDDQKAELSKLFEGGEKPTAANVNAVVRAKKSGEEASAAPSKRLLHKLLADQEAAEVLSAADAVKVLRWSLGELPARNIAGLVDAIRRVQGE